MNCKSVMLIDDDEDIRSSLIEALDFEGIEVIQAENGQVALDKLKSIPVDKLPGMILLDLQMPVMDGHQFLNELLKQPTNPINLIPIIVATAKGSGFSLDNIPLALETLRKPMDLEELYRLVDKYCRKA